MHLSVLFFCFLCFTKVVLSTPTDIFSSSSFLKDPQTIVSKNNAFSLGFFSPSNSSHRYVGIWYNAVSSQVNVIWVANREVPLNDSSGRLKISESGNKLIILNGHNNVIWSSALLPKNVSTAQILDSGNLVLLGKSGNKMWQSFDYPTDSVLPNMEVTARNISGKISPVLRSWKSPSDPSIGRFSAGIDSLSLPQLVTWDGDRPYWRSGPWSGNIFIGIQYNEDYTYTGWRLTYNGQDSISMMYSYPNRSILSFYGLTSQGRSFQSLWDSNGKRWVSLWHSPETECSVYGTCGEFGIGTCVLPNSPMCECLTGFVPKNEIEWKKGNWSNGCVRKTVLQCPNDGFFKLDTVKVPDHAKLSLGYVEDQCKEVCFIDCSCLAYSYYSGIGCMLWNRSLIDIVKFSAGGANLFLRLSKSDIVKDVSVSEGENLSAGKWNNKKARVIIGAAGAATVTVAAIFVCVILKWRVRHKGIKTLFGISEDDQSFEKFEELPLFKFSELVAATNDFHESNTLGQGGFGAVYKGVLEDGGEIAVKRLSKTSTQGVQEFMNEVLVISKLQHRNLVKLLGCCVESQERMLIYEYLPNKSLDAFLFDPLKNGTLDWKKRSSIIEGISRGLLYLHRDSRLKIIHRDLKAANILLDEKLNPKISDFGMARIFGGEQSQADTTRVVGTYGYMPPEYAIQGRFSEKSDVFSFGVLMLEIIAGKKTLWYDEESLSLLGYVWKLWSEDNVGPLIDPVISDQAFETEILKCIQVALLCVQEYAEDRPDISIVISMLTSENTASFRQPKPPGFTRLCRASADTSTQNYHKVSNGLTATSMSGR